MLPPNGELRRWVRSQFDQSRHGAAADNYAVNEESEALLERVLDRITAGLREARSQNQEQRANELLAVIEAWTGLASYATIRTYGAESPWPKGLAGWSNGVASRLRRLGSQLEEELREVAIRLHAEGWSISVTFPLGVSVSLSWASGPPGSYPYYSDLVGLIQVLRREVLQLEERLAKPE